MLGGSVHLGVEATAAPGAAPLSPVKAASPAAARAGDASEWQHPAAIIGTPHAHTVLDLDGQMEPSPNRERTGVPESSSVVTARSMQNSEQPVDEQVLNDRAVSVLRRVKMKLAGSDFPDQAARLDVATQVNRLVSEAQSDLNLCQLYVGWCPFW